MENSRKEIRRWSGCADWWEIWNLRQEIDAREETEIIEKGGMVVWEIGVGEDPTNLAHVHVGIVPIHKNHADAEVNLFPRITST